MLVKCQRAEVESVVEDHQHHYIKGWHMDLKAIMAPLERPLKSPEEAAVPSIDGAINTPASWHRGFVLTYTKYRTKLYWRLISST
jgi:hypothetical protein